MRRTGISNSAHIVAVFTVIVVIVFYTLVSAPGIGLVDSGELTVVAQTLSIAHPTGYPLYALLGRVWLLITNAEPARGMVLFSCLAAAFGAGLLAWIIIRHIKAALNRHDTITMIAAIITVSGFALSSTMWSAIRFAEVYPLTFLIGTLLLCLTALYIHESKRLFSISILICYLWGIGLGNHLTILWFFPVVLYVIIRTARRSTDLRLFILFSVAAVAVGTSVNLFLPIRSSVEPVLDWSDPQTLPNLLRHLSAWQYRVWMFHGGGEQFIRKFGAYLASVPVDIGWGAVIGVIFGLWSALKHRFALVWIAFLVWIIGVFYNLNYDIPDIATYFMALYSPLFFICGYGIVEVIAWINNRFHNSVLRNGGILLIAALILLTALPSSFASAREGDDRFAERFARELLRTLPDSALVLQAHWDIQSPTIYLQKIRNERADVIMLDINLMQRSWYIKQERRAYPDVFEELDREVNQFLKEVAVFEARKPFDGKRIETAYLALLNGIIERNMKYRPVFVRDMQASRHPGIAASLSKSPGAYFLRIGETDNNDLVLNPDSILTEGVRYTDRERHLLREAALSVCLQGRYAAAKGDATLMQETLKSAQRFAPDDPAVKQYETMVRELMTSNGAVKP